MRCVRVQGAPSPTTRHRRRRRANRARPVAFRFRSPVVGSGGGGHEGTDGRQFTRYRGRQLTRVLCRIRIAFSFIVRPLVRVFVPVYFLRLNLCLFP